MTLDEVIHVHERLNKLGWAVFEQFVTLAEAGTADQMADAENDGQLNPNAVEMIAEALRDLLHAISDDELRDEIKNLANESGTYLAAADEAYGHDEA